MIIYETDTTLYTLSTIWHKWDMRTYPFDETVYVNGLLHDASTLGEI